MCKPFFPVPTKTLLPLVPCSDEESLSSSTDGGREDLSSTESSDVRKSSFFFACGDMHAYT